jgi:prepilin-type N-terminal cleavage/methylation domain-containing protein
MKKHSRADSAFTLIELLVVITIIVVLLGLLFPAFQGVQNQAKKTQAKNDLTQIVTAVNAFYTEYGKYPLPAGASVDGYTYGDGSNSSKGLFDALRGLDPALNPRQIVFISPPNSKDQTNPEAGMGPTGDDQLYDPWGKSAVAVDAGIYHIRIDADYDNQVPNPYIQNTGAGPLEIRQGVIAWSLGKDGKLGKSIGASKGSGSKNFSGSDDVISWQ